MEAFQIEGKDGYRKDIREVNAKNKKSWNHHLDGANEGVKDTDDAKKCKGKRLLRKEMIQMHNNFEGTFLLIPNLFSPFALYFFFYY